MVHEKRQARVVEGTLSTPKNSRCQMNHRADKDNLRYARREGRNREARLFEEAVLTSMARFLSKWIDFNLEIIPKQAATFRDTYHRH